MKTYLDCIPCFFRQALFAARAVTEDEDKIKAILDKVGMLVPDIAMSHTPPETAIRVYGIVREVTGVKDPFKPMKERAIKSALGMVSVLRNMVRESQDPLETAVRIAIAGNVIDFGANPEFHLEQEIRDALEKPLAVDQYKAFGETLEHAEKILYLADNAGETVFDRILIEVLEKPVTYIVRDVPIINDATLEDAKESGLEEVASVLSSGCDAPGTLLSRCSRAFVERFSQADLIISKGQGNYETLSGERGPLFFLLKVKCPVIARHIGSEEGDIIIKRSQV